MLTRNFSFGPKWILGLIVSVTGPVSYKVRLEDGSVVRRHVDQILVHPQKDMERRQTDTVQQGHTITTEETLLDVEEVVLSSDKVEESEAAAAAGESGTVRETVAVTASPVRRQSRREVKLPSHLKDFQVNY